MALLDRFRLTDRVALVTGAAAASAAASPLAFAEMGADVVCAARTEKEIEATADAVARLRPARPPASVRRHGRRAARRAGAPHDARVRPHRPAGQQRRRLPAHAVPRHRPPHLGMVHALQPHLGVRPDARLPAAHAGRRRRRGAEHLLRGRTHRAQELRRLRHRQGGALVHDQAARRRAGAAGPRQRARGRRGRDVGAAAVPDRRDPRRRWRR